MGKSGKLKHQMGEYNLISQAIFALGISVLAMLFLRRRAIVESIYGQLNNISQIEHTYHHLVNPFAYGSPYGELRVVLS